MSAKLQSPCTPSGDDGNCSRWCREVKFHQVRLPSESELFPDASDDVVEITQDDNTHIVIRPPPPIRVDSTSAPVFKTGQALLPIDDGIYKGTGPFFQEARNCSALVEYRLMGLRCLKQGNAEAGITRLTSFQQVMYRARPWTEVCAYFARALRRAHRPETKRSDAFALALPARLRQRAHLIGASPVLSVNCVTKLVKGVDGVAVTVDVQTDADHACAYFSGPARDWVQYLRDLPAHEDEQAWMVKSCNTPDMAIFLGLLTYPRVLQLISLHRIVMLTWTQRRQLETMLNDPARAVCMVLPRVLLNRLNRDSNRVSDPPMLPYTTTAAVPRSESIDLPASPAAPVSTAVADSAELFSKLMTSFPSKGLRD
jgi:hypothetical protein